MDDHVRSPVAIVKLRSDKLKSGVGGGAEESLHWTDPFKNFDLQGFSQLLFLNIQVLPPNHPVTFRQQLCRLYSDRCRACLQEELSMSQQQRVIG